MNVVLPLREFGPRLKATTVGLGCGGLSGESGGYGFGAMTDGAAQRVLEKSYELGIRLFDTAPIYGFGESERRLGKFFKAHPSFMNDSVIVTKLGVDWDDSKNVRIDNSPEAARRMLGQSLERLGLSKVHVYMIHWPDLAVPVERTMETLADLKSQGMIGSIGVSNFSPEMIKQAEKIAPIDVIQAPFSFASASAKETLLPFCGKEARGFMSYATLAKGILAGTVTGDRKFEDSDVRARSNKTLLQLEAIKDELAQFRQLAADSAMSVSQLATAWVLSHASVSTALCGCKSIEQVAEIVGAADAGIRPSVKAKLDELSLAATTKFDRVR